MAKSTSSFVVDAVVKWLLLCLLEFVLIYSKFVALKGEIIFLRKKKNTEKKTLKKRSEKEFLIWLHSEEGNLYLQFLICLTCRFL